MGQDSELCCVRLPYISHKLSLHCSSSCGPVGLCTKHWVGYQNPEPFVWLVLIGQVPDICSVYFNFNLLFRDVWSRFPEPALTLEPHPKKLTLLASWGPNGPQSCHRLPKHESVTYLAIHVTCIRTTITKISMVNIVWGLNGPRNAVLHYEDRTS